MKFADKQLILACAVTFFVFKISFLSKYRVIYDYIVKWCSGNGYNEIGVYRWIFPKCWL